MTTQTWNVMNKHRIAAITEVKLKHCPAPTYKPPADVRSTMTCPKCGGRLAFTVSSQTGISTGRCNSVGCVTWSAQ
ncbi:hypothetical protein PSQ40_04705 [Curvibacter sp. HBC61]|uniref:Uncharacterized protein n=1 Tax=Curvibacter cyanobacteriorum TaxID=3026422 RepID=A0ABT5MV06_9BURK|nr:hypothetical protein [Curvibacter sp. HBC61]MDD0837865.1 hypothetical protein [Curvibacter sp. HBC61]